jgi:ATP adenylyltransferase
MDRFWTPWRGEYLISDPSAQSKCVLCEMAVSAPDKNNLVLFHSEHSFAVMNKYPYNNGHIMVVPKKHVDSFTLLSEAEYTDLHSLLKKAVSVIYKTYNPQGCNIGMNMGRAAGAGIDKHLHFHIVPRWNGDTNFMPVLSEIKIISEHLFTSYDLLIKNFKELV